jgi:hypothetical protein
MRLLFMFFVFSTLACKVKPPPSPQVVPREIEHQKLGANRGPNRPTHLVAVVADRRATTFQLKWTAPADGQGGRVASYDVFVWRGCNINCPDGGYPTDAGDSCVSDGGNCQCQGYPSCAKPGMTADEIVDANITVCKQIYTGTPASPGQPDGTLVPRNMYCPPDGGAGYLR